MDVCNEENSASFHTVALDFPVITNPRAFRSECFSTQTLFSPKGPVGLLVFGWANCMWILSWCYFLGEKLGLHCPPRHLIQPAGSCGVSKRPADGSTAEFSRGLVQARHGEGWKQTKQEGDLEKKNNSNFQHIFSFFFVRGPFLLELVELKLMSLKI